MNLNTLETGNNPNPVAEGISRKTAYVCIAAMLLLALGLRLIAITRPPMVFHSSRQYDGAKIARRFYIAASKDAPAWQRAVVEADTPNFMEPPLLNWVAYKGYGLSGHEALWIPRAFSATIWVLSGIGVYLLGRAFLSRAGALFATAYFLFTPYAVVASRSFQPDALIVALMVWALYVVVRYARNPSTANYLFAIAVSSASILAKPVMTLFVIAMVFVILRLNKQDLRPAIRDHSNWLFPPLIALPAIAYTIYGFTAGGFLSGHGAAKIMPHLWFTGAYWTGWLRNVKEVFGLGIAVIAFAGAFLVRKEDGRVILLASFAGYLLFGLVFSYHIMTHDYYHLQLLPVVGLGLGAGCAR